MEESMDCDRRAGGAGLRAACAALSALAVLALGGGRAVAQPPSDGATAGAGDTAALAARLDELAARSEAQARALEEANARVAALEAEEAAEDAAEAAAAEEEDAASGPVIHPLASLFTRFEHREGYDALPVSRALTNVGCTAGPGGMLADNDCVRFRARVGFEIQNITLGSGYSAAIRFLPQLAGHWAMPGFTLGGPGTGTSASGGIVDALLGIHEASLILNLETWARFEIGRFEMAYGENVVIGNLDWHPNGRAFDGARMRITPSASSYWIDVFWTLVNEGHALSLTGAPTGGGFGQADQYFYGVYAGLGPLLDARPSTALDVYALALQTNNRADVAAGAEREWSHRTTIGARFRYRVDVVDVRAEGAAQLGREGGLRDPVTMAFGRQQEVVAGFFLGEVGVNLLDDHLRLALEGNYASGNDPTTTNANEGYFHLFPTARAFLGGTNVMGARTNVASGVFHGAVRPVDQLALNLDVHVLVVPERGAGPTNYAGSEGDLNLVWTPFPGLRLRAMYGVFIPETAFWRGVASPGADPVHYFEAELGFVLR